MGEIEGGEERKNSAPPFTKGYKIIMI